MDGSKILIAAMTISSMASAQFDTSKTKYKVHFDFDQARAIETMDTIINLSDSIIRFDITGHTDDKGTDEYNQKLGKSRAKHVYEFLFNSFPKTDFNVSSKGESMPLVSNDSKDNRQLNRRVEIEVTSIRKRLPNLIMTTILKEVSEEIDDTLGVDLFSEDTTSRIPEVEMAVCDLPQPPVEGCRTHFSGLLMDDKSLYQWSSVIFTDDKHSDQIGCGHYPDFRTMKQTYKASFDGMVIDEGTRVIIYSKPNYEGDILLDAEGPIVINNGTYKKSMRRLKFRDYKNQELQEKYPQEKRTWSSTNMHRWQDGSVKILCASESDKS